MQPRLPFSDAPAADLPPDGGSHTTADGGFRHHPSASRGFRLQAEGASFIIHFVRMRRARRYILRVRPDGDLRVTIPRGGSRAEALRFAERHLSWATRERARQLASRRPPLEWLAGTEIMVDGRPARIGRDGDLVRVGAMSVRVPPDMRDLRPAIEHALREEARRVLPAQVLAVAASYGLTVTRVTIRNQRSRWGSCSRDGRIALNFRLLQMPPAVREYIVLHELMHLRHANHSRRFWRAVESVCPAFRDAERWLKRTGHDLF